QCNIHEHRLSCLLSTPCLLLHLPSVKKEREW
uniref:Uncharacterized protein n=1 Tax=Amphimedon queenslandica TaxID=400682 RepID=A0A1X7UZZ3_AMPQE